MCVWLEDFLEKVSLGASWDLLESYESYERSDGAKIQSKSKSNPVKSKAKSRSKSKSKARSKSKSKSDKILIQNSIEILME